LQTHVHIPDAAAARDATDLMERFGDFAADEAAMSSIIAGGGRSSA